MSVYEYKDYVFTVIKGESLSLHAKNKLTLLEYQNDNVTSPCCTDIYLFLKRNGDNGKLEITLNDNILQLNAYINEYCTIKISLDFKDNVLNRKFNEMRKEIEDDYNKKLEEMTKSIQELTRETNLVLKTFIETSATKMQCDKCGTQKSIQYMCVIKICEETIYNCRDCKEWCNQ